MRQARALLLALLLGAATPLWAQPVEEPAAAQETPTEVVAQVPGAEPDYASWGETAQRAEALSEAGRGSAFALNKLREEMVNWREVWMIAGTAILISFVATLYPAIQVSTRSPLDGLRYD